MSVDVSGGFDPPVQVASISEKLGTSHDMMNTSRRVCNLIQISSRQTATAFSSDKRDVPPPDNDEDPANIGDNIFGVASVCFC